MTAQEFLRSEAVIAAIGGLLGVLLGWYAKRPKILADARAASASADRDVQAAITDATTRIVDHYTRALAGAQTEMRALRDEVAALRATIDELEGHVDDLVAALEKHGVKPPVRRGKKP